MRIAFAIIGLYAGLSSRFVFGYRVDNERKLAECPVGSLVDGSGKFCCPATCGSCGGFGCDTRPGGTSSCCTSAITIPCGNPPCIATVTPPQTADASAPPVSPTQVTGCPISGILDKTRNVCCTKECGTCGGTGCDTRPGGAANCCASRITQPCKDGKVPCVLTAGTSPSLPPPSPPPSSPPSAPPSSPPSPPPTDPSSPVTLPPPPPNGCPTGGIKDYYGTKCCPATCGTCGGLGCDTRPGGTANCCSSAIQAPCSNNTLPCVLSAAPATVEPSKLVPATVEPSKPVTQPESSPPPSPAGGINCQNGGTPCGRSNPGNYIKYDLPDVECCFKKCQRFTHTFGWYTVCM